MPAIATARKRLERGIKRIEKTGWCQGSLRCRRWDDEKERYRPISQAKVCLLGALITDQEAKEDMVVTALVRDGVPEAIDAVFDGLRDLDRDAYNRHMDVAEEGRDPVGQFIVNWNDNLGGEEQGRVLQLLKRGLERLPVRKQK